MFYDIENNVVLYNIYMYQCTKKTQWYFYVTNINVAKGQAP